MAKIAVNKTVSWESGGRRITGKIRQILGDHVVVRTASSDYVVMRSVLTVEPTAQGGPKDA